ncbi:hypothetical protein GCM10022288_05090 [Gryllotalpicola kribbensis]|jgi:hypothetical protein|uniref:Peptidase n=1 Tax=Gryllotalpicola kribbensis TaxID=993084 RepID=A0ABP8AIC8_9MICO
MIDWLAFVEVLIAALVGAAVVVSLYALGLRLLAVAGRTPFVPPVAYDEAITVLSPKQMKREAKKVKKARKGNPYSPVVKRIALIAAYALFSLSGIVVLFGIYLIVPYFHG